MSKTSFATFNVNELNDNMKRKSAFNFLNPKKLDVILLQETHSTSAVEKLWEMELGHSVEWLHDTNKTFH